MKGSVDPQKLAVASVLKDLVPFETALGALDAKTPEQKAALADAQAKYAAFVQTRILMALQLAVPFSKALLVVVIVWAGLLFFGYGIRSRRNSTTLVALAFGSI